MINNDERKAPVLRFKGFTDDWEQRKLGEISEIIGGGTPSTKNPKYWNGNINWYSPTEIGKNIFVKSSVKKISQLGLKHSSAKILPAKKTILFTSRAGIGDMAIMLSDGSTNQGFQSWVIDPQKIDIYFLYYSGNLIKKEAIRKASGSTFLEISNKEVKKLSLNLPTNEEQKLIGELILKIDKLIFLQQRKLERLSNLKIGLNQQIFNELDLNKFPQISLHSIGKAYSGLTGKNKNDFGHGEAHYVTYININKNTISDINEIEKIGIDPKQNMVKKGDIFFTISSETPNEVGLTSVWPKNTNNLYLNSFCFGYRPDQTKVDSFYLGYLFRSDYFRKKIFPLAQGISRYNLSKKNVLNLNIGLPNMNQQVEIVEILTTLDNEIQSILRKINYLKSIKQFLLQNMFI